MEIDGVTSNVPRSNFDEADLDTLADSILESGGILKPLVLKKIGFEKYEVIDGHFEYYAAVRAREKNPNRGEIVNAFIIPAEKEDAALNQVAILKEGDTEKIVNPIDEKTEIGKLLDQNKQIYAMLKQLISNPPANTQKVDVDDRLESLENKIEHLTSVVETLTILVQQVIDLPKPQKLNLVTATDEEIANYLTNENVNQKERKAALEAIRYWRKPNKTLTWANLKTSTKSGAEYSIKGFGPATYQKLKEIAEIRTQ
ncbi:ParB N-terminal domain-containing protein [Anabaena sp. PCC 7108]|uniref:ParB N-terminal domain-containing protein n=1 Tax=Anabaena sp. PCC 7108 TaxID=163908 RepID=UPI001ED9C270|nr:ParB N-terminal domain-containing protein [Anabaena sp. PCC 7108]